ncbi:hypothetical protein [Streptomyces sp. NPDC051211]|uniref:hypothetical protein n=1 Tax=Streptomyces sp. NPDC051211 TaxID=3154643 RepID=UPI00344F9405
MRNSNPHPLLDHLLAAADGQYPEIDGGVTVLPPFEGGLECSFAFTGHAYVATRLPAEEVLAQGPDGFGLSMGADFLRHLAGPGGWIGVIDASLVARGAGEPGTGARLGERHDVDDHPRVRHARSVRNDVRVYGDERGFVTVGQGLAGRREIGIALDEEAGQKAGRGVGRTLLLDALTLVPEGEPVFAAVSPGNSRSLRAFLAVGFTPIGSEVLLRPRQDQGRHGGVSCPGER